MMFKKLGMTLLTGVAVLALAACGSAAQSENSLDAIKEKGKLVVATSPDYAPFEFKALIDGKDTIVGSDIALAQAIADELGVELEVSGMNFDNVLASVKTGKADIAIAGLSYTEERAKSFDFSDAYYETSNAIVVKADAEADYQELKALAGKKIAVLKGSIEEELAREQLTDSSIVALTNMGEAINELKSGQVDAVVLEAPVGKGYVEQNTDLIVSSLALEVGEGDAKAIAMPKGSPELQEAINAVLEKLAKEDKYGQFLSEAAQLTEKAIED